MHSKFARGGPKHFVCCSLSFILIAMLGQVLGKLRTKVVLIKEWKWTHTPGPCSTLPLWPVRIFGKLILNSCFHSHSKYFFPENVHPRPVYLSPNPSEDVWAGLWCCGDWDKVWPAIGVGIALPTLTEVFYQRQWGIPTPVWAPEAALPLHPGTDPAPQIGWDDLI